MPGGRVDFAEAARTVSCGGGWTYQQLQVELHGAGRELRESVRL
jgi:hypothetical protein